MTKKAKGIAVGAATLALAMALGACDLADIGTGERGSGDLISETRQVDPFSRIEVSDAVTLTVTVDATAEHAVTVTYDDNLLDNLTTEIRGDKLIVGMQGSVNLTGSADRAVDVVLPALDSLEASGATDVTVMGATGDLDLEVSGASNLDLGDLVVGDVTIAASGASSVLLDTDAGVSGAASGASSVTVRGNPTTVLVETSGAASVDLP